MALLLDSIFSISFFLGWFEEKGPDWLADLSALAQVIIAIVNIILFYRISTKQSKLQKEAILHSARLNQQNIETQFFNDLIIQPNFHHILAFFKEVESINSWNLDNAANRTKALKKIKPATYAINRDFTDLLDAVDPQLEADARNIVDSEFLDEVTKLFFDGNYDKPNEFNKNYENLSKNLKKNYLKKIYSFVNKEAK